MVDDNCHVMDALKHNEAEKCLLTMINELAEISDVQIKIEVQAKEEGGLQDIFHINFKKGLESPYLNLLCVFVCYYFSSSYPKNEEMKNRVEIAQILRENNFSAEEAIALIGSDAPLKKWASVYYKTLSDEECLKKVDAGVRYEDNPPVVASIDKSQFSHHILPDSQQNTIQVKENTTIHIVAPVLFGGRKIPWRGMYSGVPIDFKIEDQDFLKQVYNHEVKFSSGTSITCRLKVETKQIVKNGIEEIKSSYTVLLVTQWADDEHYQNETKRYKRLKLIEEEEKRQTSLFNDEDFE
jgi:hypothetical protein